MSIRTKFRLGFMLLLATFATFGWYTVDHTSQLNQESLELIDRSTLAMMINDEIAVAIFEVGKFVDQALLEADVGKRHEFLANAQAWAQKIQELEVQYKQFYPLPSQQVELDELERHLEAYLHVLDKRYTVSEAGLAEISPAHLREEAQLRSQVVASLAKLDIVTGRMNRDAALSSAEAASAKSRIGVVTAVCVVALVLLGMTALSRHIFRNVQRLVEAIDLLVKGDLTIVVPLTQQRNELGDVARALEQFRLNALDRERLQRQEARDLEFALRIQLAGVPCGPSTLPDDGTFEICGELAPSRIVSGDFLDFHKLDSHRLAMAIGDASGKGVASAMFASWAFGTLKSESLRAADPGGCLTAVNKVLARQNHDMMFMTAFYGVLDVRDGSFSFANAGHELPYLLNGTDGVRQITASPGLPLGVAEKFDFETRQVRLAPGDAIVLFTDGITEAMAANDQLFGLDRLQKVLANHRQAGCQDLIDALLASVREFGAGMPQADDIAVLVMRYNGPPPTSRPTG
jgi:serine phosphatase RsbU (regulator of sigma subunit)